MAKIESHHDLRVWPARNGPGSGDVSLEKQLPLSERYGLVQQVTRSCVAVPANLAEATRAELARIRAFCVIARGSLMETETYVMIAERLGFATHESTQEVLERITELGRMLTALRQRLTETRAQNTCAAIEPTDGRTPITRNLYPITYS